MGSLASFRNRTHLRTPLVQSLYVEVKTGYWSAIQGATAFKFGVYFGRVKSDSQEKYQFTAFAAVKGVTELVREGAQNKHDFAAIDGNPLSSMFKAKILSLYFPDRFWLFVTPIIWTCWLGGLDDLSRGENSEPPWMLNCLDWVLVNALDTAATSPADQFNQKRRTDIDRLCCEVYCPHAGEFRAAEGLCRSVVGPDPRRVPFCR